MGEEDSFSSSSSSHRGAGSSSLITINLRNTGQKKKHAKGGSLQVEKREDGYYYVKAIPRNLKSIGVGDRVLEINGTDWTKFRNELNANDLIATLQLEIVTSSAATTSGYESDDNEEVIRNPPPRSNKTSNNQNNNAKSHVSRKMSPARARSPFNPGGGQKIQYNNNMPYYNDGSDSSSSEGNGAEDNFQRRSSLEERSRKVATERAKKKLQQKQEERRRKQQEAKEEEGEDVLKFPEEQEFNSDYPKEHESPLRGAAKRVRERPKTKDSPTASTYSYNNDNIKKQISNNTNPPPPPFDNNSVYETPPTTRKKKAVVKKKANVGCYSPKRSDGWTKVATNYKK